MRKRGVKRWEGFCRMNRKGGGRNRMLERKKERSRKREGEGGRKINRSWKIEKRATFAQAHDETLGFWEL